MEVVYLCIGSRTADPHVLCIVRRVEQWRMKIVVWDRFCTNIGVLRILLLLAN